MATTNFQNTTFVRIIEQPVGLFRFRYKSEGKSKIPGASSTPTNKTAPTIEICGSDYKGKAYVFITCVTKDDDKIHPHKIVGNGQNYTNGMFKGQITIGPMKSFSFNGLGIECRTVKKESANEKRNKKFVEYINKIDLTVVRLKFHVYLPGKEKYDIPLAPVFSDPIYNTKSNTNLFICELSHCSGSTEGGEKIILLCEKVIKEDIAVKFFEESNGNIVWEDYGSFLPSNVHRQVAISIRTPKYTGISNGKSLIKCYIQLVRLSDGKASHPLEFDFIPTFKNDSNIIELKRKKQKLDPILVNLQKIQKSEIEELIPAITTPSTTNFNLFLGASANNTNVYREQLSIPLPRIFSEETGAVGFVGNNFNSNAFEEQPNIHFISNNLYQQNYDQQNWNMNSNQNNQIQRLTLQTINYDQNVMIQQNSVDSTMDLIDSAIIPREGLTGEMLASLNSANNGTHSRDIFEIDPNTLNLGNLKLFN